jgi:hypothetical protein
MLVADRVKLEQALGNLLDNGADVAVHVPSAEVVSADGSTTMGGIMRSRPLGAAGLTGLLGAIIVAGVVIASAAAKPATITLHFFSKAQSFKLTDPSGKPVSPTAIPGVGDVFDVTDLDYVGNHKHHAKQWTATDHLRCVFQTTPSAPTGTATAVCDGQIAIGGSMLLADHVTATLKENSSAVPLNVGTGIYRGYHGTATSVSIGNSPSSDFNVVIHR